MHQFNTKVWVWLIYVPAYIGDYQPSAISHRLATVANLNN